MHNQLERNLQKYYKGSQYGATNAEGKKVVNMFRSLIIFLGAVVLSRSAVAGTVNLKPGNWALDLKLELDGKVHEESRQECREGGAAKLNDKEFAEQLSTRFGCTPTKLKSYDGAMEFRFDCESPRIFEGAIVVITHSEAQYELMSEFPSGNLEFRSTFEGACES